MADKLLPGGEASKVTREEQPQAELIVGSWWWVNIETYDRDKDGNHITKKVLCCLTHVGSNYAEFEGAGTEGYETRVHFDKFDAVCTPEPDADAIIAREVETRRQKTTLLMEKVKDTTARLALEAGRGSNETEALTVGVGAAPIAEYKTALIKAKDETLPELFKQIKETNEAMGKWMRSQLIPLQAQASALEPAIDKIKARIFNVELYAGLIEEVVQIKDGQPAPTDTPTHLYQRRAYMDEECLARYQTGGMEFANIGAFDDWFAKPENLHRLIPHTRGILAMQVRRNTKERNITSILEFVNIVLGGIEKSDKFTFLYIRNGEQVYRLSTGIDFDEQMFPDTNDALMTDEMYARMSGGRVDEVITKGHYESLIAERKQRKKEHEQKKKEWKAAVAELKAQGVPKKDWPSEPWYHEPFYSHNEYRRWSPDDVYYDDISRYIGDQIDKHNRLVLVLQGLLDRSMVLHPHPPYKLWDPVDFGKAFTLVYDDSRALVPGDAPDFEVYREQLNKTLKVGSVTVGQEDYWEEREAEKENDRQERDWRIKNKSSYKRYRPYGNPGPGTLATVQTMSSKGCSYKWFRERRTYSRWGEEKNIPQSITVPKNRLLNVDAYTPGDFHLFFDDPRTRALYLKWAPFLLEAEEYHAGNRGIRPITSRFVEADGLTITSYGGSGKHVRSYSTGRRDVYKDDEDD